jgi:hypothetical protein
LRDKVERYAIISSSDINDCWSRLVRRILCGGVLAAKHIQYSLHLLDIVLCLPMHAASYLYILAQSLTDILSFGNTSDAR